MSNIERRTFISTAGGATVAGLATGLAGAAELHHLVGASGGRAGDHASRCGDGQGAAQQAAAGQLGPVGGGRGVAPLEHHGVGGGDVLKNQDEGFSSFSASGGPRWAPGPSNIDSG